MLAARSTMLLATAVLLFAPEPSRGQEMTEEARAYLGAALDTIEAVTMDADQIPWEVVRDSAFLIAAGARRTSDTWGAVHWALQRANRHSFLQAPRPGIVIERVRERIGYLRVPQRGGVGQTLADSLHAGVARLDAEGVCGWIVDLRGNGGGNMWPMLAGVGPLLGDSIVGAFGTAADADRWFYRSGVSGILTPDGRVDTVSSVTVPPHEVGTDLPLAVLIDAGTGSSGEAVAVAFSGRAHTRLVGGSTAGYATVNRGSRLSDGANMVVTTGFYTDRLGREHGRRLDPDIAVDAPRTDWPFPTDRTATVATEWLLARPGCS